MTVSRAQLSRAQEAAEQWRPLCFLARLRHDAERVIRAQMASPRSQPGCGTREPGGHCSGVS